jgi:hypothetical protein
VSPEECEKEVQRMAKILEEADYIRYSGKRPIPVAVWVALFGLFVWFMVAHAESQAEQARQETRSKVYSNCIHVIGGTTEANMDKCQEIAFGGLY